MADEVKDNRTEVIAGSIEGKHYYQLSCTSGVVTGEAAARFAPSNRRSGMAGFLVSGWSEETDQQ